MGSYGPCNPRKRQHAFNHHDPFPDARCACGKYTRDQYLNGRGLRLAPWKAREYAVYVVPAASRWAMDAPPLFYVGITRRFPSWWGRLWLFLLLGWTCRRSPFGDRS